MNNSELDKIIALRNKFISDGNMTAVEALEKEFPQIKATEFDIIRTLLNFVEIYGEDSAVFDKAPKTMCIDWLKRQEEALVNHFHKGEFVINPCYPDDVFRIREFNKDYNGDVCCHLENLNGLEGHDCEFCPVTKIRHWTPEDAKDGDIMTCGQAIFIYRGKDEEKGVVMSYCSTLFYRPMLFVGEDNQCNIGDMCPALPQERERLFEVIEKAGRTWDAKNKTLSDKIPNR